MKRTNKTSKLNLSTETIRTLQPDELAGVAGGDGAKSRSIISCDSCFQCHSNSCINCPR